MEKKMEGKVEEEENEELKVVSEEKERKKWRRSKE